MLRFHALNIFCMIQGRTPQIHFSHKESTFVRNRSSCDLHFCNKFNIDACLQHCQPLIFRRDASGGKEATGFVDEAGSPLSKEAGKFESRFNFLLHFTSS